MSFESGLFDGIGILNRNSVNHSNVFSELSWFPALGVGSIGTVEDRNWSWSSLRAMFKCHGLGELYKRYVSRLQNSYFNAYLLLEIAVSLVYMGTILIVNRRNIKAAYPEVAALITVTFFSVIVFLAVCDEKLFRSSKTAQKLMSLFIVLLIVGSDLSVSVYFFLTDRIVRTPTAFHSLIVIYMFLPLERKLYSVVLGSLVTAIHLLTYGTYFYSDSHDRAKRIVADAVFYICGNCVGIYCLFMNEVAVRRAFLDRRGYIRSTIKKDYETAQEEQLLLSILPEHVSVQVKQELMAVFREIEDAKSIRSNSHRSQHNSHGSCTVMQKKPFSQLFVERHNNVTILFADIVNFTPLTVTLTAEELVETLNQLFGQFDDAAKRHCCLRIKLLGDCYYCVSGLLSNSTSISRDAVHPRNHAKNCVLLGLEMIEIIKEVRERLHVNVQMRIGIHSGNIISGILGIYKWQYDIWSKDVTIANHMESTGRPGQVHITRQTKEILGDAFDYRCVTVRDNFLLENKIEAFVIVPEEGSTTSEGSNLLPLPYQCGNIFTKYGNRRDTDRSKSPRSSESLIKMTMKRSRMSMLEKRPTDVTGENINILIKMLSKVDEQMKEAIDKMPLRKLNLWRGFQNYKVQLNPTLMSFSPWTLEKSYMMQADPLFKFYIGCAILVLVCIGIIQGVIMPRDHRVLWIAFGAGGSYLVLVIPFVWVGYVWNRIKDPHQELDSVPDPKKGLILYFYKTSERISRSLICRTAIYLSVALVLSTFAIIDVIECDNVSLEMRILHQECQHPWYFTYSCTLAMLGIYGFFRIHYMFKLLLCIISLGAYASTMFFYRSDVFDGINVDDGSTPAMAPVYAHLIYLIRIILLLHVMDRQMEYINRLDFIWKMKLTEEHKEASITQATNAVLIYNILPVQIAKMYLDPTRMGQGYSRSYTDVAVMFASIPNFMDFYTENDLNDQGIKCLQLLNEIIVDFDNALFEIEDVEKIKVIGSTYMAACGLEVNERGGPVSRYASTDFCYAPNRSNHEPTSEENLEKRRKSLVTLVKFAASMMVRLSLINKDAFQDFELRVGIDSGPIVAGVIGAQKPMYDIWGDTVNMAARLDSTGVNGKIQVAAKSAFLLMQEGVNCVFRDRIRVKGKDKLIPAYFVKLNERYEVQCGRKRLPANKNSYSEPED